jgi:hypothetical protein
MLRVTYQASAKRSLGVNPTSYSSNSGSSPILYFRKVTPGRAMKANYIPR